MTQQPLDEIAELIVWAKNTLQSVFACSNARELALDILIEHDEENKNKWIEMRKEIRGCGSDYMMFDDDE